jgi:hypothetical protein
MASTERIFFAGATSALLIGAGFGGGILLGRAALEPAEQTKSARSHRGDVEVPGIFIGTLHTRPSPDGF